MTTTTVQRGLDQYGDRLKWIRVFELDDISRSKMATLLGDGYNDSTIKTWEKDQRIPHKAHEVARRYAEVAQAAGAAHITAEWIMYGGPNVKIDSRAPRALGHAA